MNSYVRKAVRKSPISFHLNSVLQDRYIKIFLFPPRHNPITPIVSILFLGMLNCRKLFLCCSFSYQIFAIEVLFGRHMCAICGPPTTPSFYLWEIHFIWEGWEKYLLKSILSAYEGFSMQLGVLYGAEMYVFMGIIWFLRDEKDVSTRVWYSIRKLIEPLNWLNFLVICSEWKASLVIFPYWKLFCAGESC